MEFIGKGLFYEQTFLQTHKSTYYIFALVIIAIIIIGVLTNRIADELIVDQSDRR